MRILGNGDVNVFTGTPLTSYVSPAGDFGTLTVTVDGGFEYDDPYGNRSIYDGDGQLQETKESHDLATTYVYDGGLLDEIDTPDGATTTFTNNTSTGLTDTITEPGERTVDLSYDGVANLTGLVDAAGFERSFSYSGNLLTLDNWNPQITSFDYGSTGAVKTINRGDGQTLDVTPAAVELWLADGGPTYLAVVPDVFQDAPVATTTDGLGLTTVVEPDESGRLLAKKNPDGGIETWTRDGNGNVLVDTDPLDRVTSYSYDSSGDQTTMQTAAGVTTTAYDGDNNVLSVTDPLDRTTSYSYDAERDQLDRDQFGRHDDFNLRFGRQRADNPRSAPAPHYQHL